MDPKESASVIQPLLDDQAQRASCIKQRRAFTNKLMLVVASGLLGAFAMHVVQSYVETGAVEIGSAFGLAVMVLAFLVRWRAV